MKDHLLKLANYFRSKNMKGYSDYINKIANPDYGMSLDFPTEKVKVKNPEKNYNIAYFQLASFVERLETPFLLEGDDVGVSDAEIIELIRDAYLQIPPYVTKEGKELGPTLPPELFISDAEITRKRNKATNQVDIKVKFTTSRDKSKGRQLLESEITGSFSELLNDRWSERVNHLLTLRHRYGGDKGYDEDIAESIVEKNSQGEVVINRITAGRQAGVSSLERCGGGVMDAGGAVSITEELDLIPCWTIEVLFAAIPHDPKKQQEYSDAAAQKVQESRANRAAARALDNKIIKMWEQASWKVPTLHNCVDVPAQSQLAGSAGRTGTPSVADTVRPDLRPHYIALKNIVQKFMNSDAEQEKSFDKFILKNKSYKEQITDAYEAGEKFPDDMTGQCPTKNFDKIVREEEAARN